MPYEMLKTPVNLTDKEFLRIAKLAHKHDVTFNQMCICMIRMNLAHIQKRKSNGARKKNTRRPGR